VLEVRPAPLVDFGCLFLTFRSFKDMEFPSVRFQVAIQSATSRSPTTPSLTRCTHFASKLFTERAMPLVSSLYAWQKCHWTHVYSAVANIVYSGNTASGITHQGVAIEQDYSLSFNYFLIFDRNLSRYF